MCGQGQVRPVPARLPGILASPVTERNSLHLETEIYLDMPERRGDARPDNLPRPAATLQSELQLHNCPCDKEGQLVSSDKYLSIFGSERSLRGANVVGGSCGSVCLSPLCSTALLKGPRSS